MERLIQRRQHELLGNVLMGFVLSTYVATECTDEERERIASLIESTEAYAAAVPPTAESLLRDACGVVAFGVGRAALYVLARE